jgi:hypothetical protein
LATKNFEPASTYGRSSGSAPAGILYCSRVSHVSSPVDSVADRITTSYSPTVNCASIVTPRSAPALASSHWGHPPPIDLVAHTSYGGCSGAHGSCSQYSTSRGAPIASTLPNTSSGSVLTFSSWSTTGTGTTIAKSDGGPW